MCNRIDQENTHKAELDLGLGQLALHQLGDRVQLNVRGAFVDRANLRVTVELFDWKIFRETNTAKPFDSLGAGIARHLRGEVLGHGRLLDVRKARLRQPGGVVHQQSGRFDVGGNLGDLVLHSLEGETTIITIITIKFFFCAYLKLKDWLAKLFTLESIFDRIFEHSLGQAEHLGADADATFVQRGDGILVAFAHLADDIRRGHLDIVEGHHTSARGTNAQLVLILGHMDTGCVSVHHKAGDATVSGRRVDIGEDDKKSSMSSVSDPRLGAIDHEVVALLLRSGLQGEGVGTGTRLGQAKCSHLKV